MTPRCPICSHPMTKIIPLVYSGDGVEDYTCKVNTGRECGSPVHVMIRGVIEPKNPVYVNDQLTDVVHYLKDNEPHQAGITLAMITNEIIDNNLIDTGGDSFYDDIREGFEGEL